MTEQMWRVGHEDDAVTQSHRCYSPSDLRLLLEGTGLSLVDVEPFTDEGYGGRARSKTPCSTLRSLRLPGPSTRPPLDRRVREFWTEQWVRTSA